MTQPIDNFDRQLNRSTVDRSAPFQARVQAADPDTETITLDAGSAATQIRHPFVGAGSWIRSMPAPGTRVVCAYSKVAKRLEIVGYEYPAAEDQITAYKQAQNNYRPLKPGEHEIASSGGAVSFWGSEKFKSDRAGVVSSQHDGIKLEHSVRAPTQLWRGTRNRNDVIGHEMRVGAVKRPLSPNKEAYALKLGSMPELNQFVYANEYLLALNSDVTDTPLIDIRSGEVFNDALTPGYPMAMPALGKNSLPLRHRAKYYTTVEPGTIGIPEQSTDLEVDCLGNVSLSLSKLSVIGLAVNVPIGRVLVACGLDMTLDAKLGITLTSLGSVKISGMAGVSVSTPAIVSISGDTGVHIKATGQASIETTGPTTIESMALVTVSGKAGVHLVGTAGGAGLRPINTLPIDPITGIVTWTDASVMA